MLALARVCRCETSAEGSMRSRSSVAPYSDGSALFLLWQGALLKRVMCPHVEQSS